MNFKFLGYTDPRGQGGTVLANANGPMPNQRGPKEKPGGLLRPKGKDRAGCSQEVS